MAGFPEVIRVVTRVGRGEVGAHADPVNSGEAFVALRPQDQWKTTKSPQALYEKMSEAFESFPGAQFNFTQPIAAAVDELLTGTKAGVRQSRVRKAVQRHASGAQRHERIMVESSTVTIQRVDSKHVYCQVWPLLKKRTTSKFQDGSGNATCGSSAMDMWIAVLNPEGETIQKISTGLLPERDSQKKGRRSHFNVALPLSTP